MKKKLNLKVLIPAMILFLLLPGCNTGTTPNISSGVPASSEKTSESSETSSVDSLSEPASSDVSTTSSKPTSSESKTTSSENTVKIPGINQDFISFPSTFRPTAREDIVKNPLKELVKEISYVDNMYGNELEYKAETRASYYYLSDYWYSHIAVINSYDEFKTVFDADDFYKHNKYEKYDNRYSKEFFNDNVLVMLFVDRESSRFTYSIDKITKKDNDMYIYMNNYDYSADEKYAKLYSMFRTFITISKDYMENVTNVYVCDIDSSNQPSVSLEKTVTPMIYTDAMQGNAINFKTQAVSTLGVEHKWKSHFAVIDSYNQLKKIYNSDYDESNQHYDKDYINAYNDKFFEDNVLIMLFIENGNSFIPSIEAVTKKDNKAIICVDYTEKEDCGYLDCICNIRTQIAISKKDFTGITDVVVYKTNVNPEKPVTPIKFTDSMQGSAIDFDEKTIDISIANDNWTSHIAIIRSYDELKSIYEGEKETFPKDLYIYFERDDYSKMYTEEFFEDKAIVMLFVHRGLKAKTYSIDSVTKNDNRLYIYMDNVVLDEDKQYIQVSADYRTFISVSKEDMSGITDIVVCEK